MIEVRVDVELKDTIVVAIPKLYGEGFYTCTVRVEYKWKPPRCACCKFFGHIQEECPKNPGLGVTKNLKKPSQAPKGVPSWVPMRGIHIWLVTGKVGFGTKSLLEQWRDSYVNGDYDEDTYDDNMYEGEDTPDKFKIYAIIWISEFERDYNQRIEELKVRIEHRHGIYKELKKHGIDSVFDECLSELKAAEKVDFEEMG
ncbi:zinc knuckle CX2CX4HX4C [Artemisia annua]|uniref:Zinc knuckle CX2CX4HX4C n=1 Tax=Artemisia annua TaxID=35608 RepID=A0A2U1P431_ARTAN|nr:zinc knuckle CX2CX4HX4C [Artemisia annua]